MKDTFQQTLAQLTAAYKALISRPNPVDPACSNGLFERYRYPVLIYYASSDTRVHVAKTTEGKLVDYALHTPEDGLRSAACVGQRNDLIRRNLALMGR